MRRYRALLFAVLVYVSLDQSLPAMPGALMPESADAIENARVVRGRAKSVQMPALVPLPEKSFELWRTDPEVASRLPPAPPRRVVRRHGVPAGLPPADADSTAPPEGPH